MNAAQRVPLPVGRGVMVALLLNPQQSESRTAQCPHGVGGCKPPPIWFGITYPEQLCVVYKLCRAGFFSCHDF